MRVPPAVSTPAVVVPLILLSAMTHVAAAGDLEAVVRAAGDVVAHERQVVVPRVGGRERCPG